MIQKAPDPILRVISIEKDTLSEGFRKKLGDRYIYQDVDNSVLGEHLYSLDDILENVEFTPEQVEELNELTLLCDQYRADYFRLVKN
jgi:hypothetical protein